MVRLGIDEAIMLGKRSEIIQTGASMSVDSSIITILDIVIKGLITTDKFLQTVMDKENGLMIPKAVLSYVGTLSCLMANSN